MNSFNVAAILDHKETSLLRNVNMTRIQTVAPEQATGKAKELLNAVNGKLGLVPNMMRAMANAPAVLDAYLAFSSSLARARYHPSSESKSL